MIRLVVSSSGRTRRAAVQEFLREREPSAETVLVGATRDAVDDLVAELSLEIGATFGLHRFSLSQLIAHLAALPLAAEGLAPASSLGSEAVAARAAFEAEKDGHLPELSAVSRFPGFPRALAGSLGDLRLAGLDAKTVDGHATELAALLATFDRQLTDAAIADRSRLYERARAGLRDSPLIDLGSTALILLDVTIDSAV